MAGRNVDIYFGGKLNSDDEDRVIPNGDLRDAYYLRVGSIEKSADGARTSFLGNESVEISADFLPNGTNTCIGMAPWVEQKAMVVFYHNSNGFHSIIVFFNEMNLYYALISGPQLNFDLNYPIIWAHISNNLLSWTDGREDSQFFFDDPEPLNTGRLFNPPMRINVQDALDGLYNYIDLRSIEALKWPPWKGPAVAYGTEPDKPNFIKQLSFEFAYQFGYADGEWSTYSPISDMALPVNQDWVQGPDYATPWNDNYIGVTIQTGPYRVKKLRIAVRTNGGPWLVCFELDKVITGTPDDDVYEYKFFNNNALKPVTSEINELGILYNNSNMPQVVGAQEYMQTNELAYGDFWQNYDNVEVDYTLSHTCHEIKNYRWNFQTLYIYGLNDMPLSSAEIVIGSEVTAGYTTFNFSPGDTYTLQVEITTPNLGFVLLTYTLTEQNIADALTQPTVALQVTAVQDIIAEAWANQINEEFGIVFVEKNNTFGGLFSTVQAINPATQTFVIVPFGVVALNDPSNKNRPTRRSGLQREVKQGWNYYLALQYYDRGLRDGTVQKEARQEDVLINIPFPSLEEARDAFVNRDNPYYVTVNMTINNLPPIWADSYQIVVRFAPFRGVQLSLFRLEVDPGFQNAYKITYDDLYQKQYGAKYDYVPQVGDIVRFIRKNLNSATTDPAPYTDSYNEMQVLKASLSEGVGDRPCIWVSQFDLGILGSETSNELGYTSQIFEIFQPPVIDENAPWWEIYDGEIGDAHLTTRYHKGGGFSTMQDVLGGCPVGSTLVAYLNMGAYVGNPRATTIRLTNSNGDVQIIEIPYILEGAPGQYYSALADATLYDFSDTAGGKIEFVLDQINVSESSAAPAVVALDWGNVYYRQRLNDSALSGSFLVAAYSYIEDPARSDFYISDFYHLGRLAVENPENRRYHYKADAIHSGTIIDQTLLNNLCNFNGTKNRISLNEKNGTIRAMKYSGKTLHVIQDIVTTPVYTGTYSVGADGAVSQPAFVSTTFGAPGKEVPYGTVHPRTVRLIDNQLFFFDLWRKTWAKLTDGGHYSICDGQFKFSKFAFEWSDQFSSVSFFQPKVFSVIDPLNKEYITFYKPFFGQINAIVFNYEKNQWSHRIDYPMEWGETLLSTLISTDEWQLYKHNQGENLNFYGTVYGPPSLTFVFNQGPNVMKKPLAIGLKTNALWKAEEITVPATINYPNGMTSEIPSAVFRPIEEFIWAPYLKDKSNIVPEIPDLDSADKALVSGRDLIGSSITHKITADDAEAECVIFSANIEFDLQREPK